MLYTYADQIIIMKYIKIHLFHEWITGDCVPGITYIFFLLNVCLHYKKENIFKKLNVCNQLFLSFLYYIINLFFSCEFTISKWEPASVIPGEE